MILKGGNINKIKVRPLTLPTLGSEFNDTELTFLFKDGHVEIVEINKYSQKTSTYPSLKDMFDYLFSGDDFLLDQNLSLDFPHIYKDILTGLKEEGIDIKNIVHIYYMEM